MTWGTSQMVVGVELCHVDDAGGIAHPQRASRVKETSKLFATVTERKLRVAKEYVEKLSSLVRELKIADEVASPLEVKHFFSGAALYSDERICASWSPVGLAFKLSEQESEQLIADGLAKPLRYFAKGHVKKGYALFENPDDRKPSEWRAYFIKAIRNA